MDEARIDKLTDWPVANYFSSCYFICPMMSSMLSLFLLQVLEKLALVILDVLVHSELAIFTGIQLIVSKRQELPYICIFIGIFIVFVVFT